ncbi:MAG: type II secretion system F family protein [Pseudomonadales bacterium]|nr:type II secretion system F family protein [Candidatus Woesebacteria bacterium]MCB9802317.1 type II secretion system F family protein [Pseudomonadales bacterium]
MPFFNYTAKNTFGNIVKGKVEAQTERHAAIEITNRGLLLIKLTPLTSSSFAFLKNISGGIKTAEVVRFTRQLSTMITAGLPLASALSILVRQNKGEFAALIATILQDVEGGMTFSEALGKHPKVFSRLYVQLVNAGETGGVMDQVLDRLAINLEKSHEFRSKTKGAMIYPAIVVIAMIVVGFIMMIFVIPQMTAMYEDFGAELPLPTKILIGSSNFLVQYKWIFLALLAIGIGFFTRWKNTEAGQRLIAQTVLRLPIFGDLMKKIILTEFARTIALLLGAGISLLKALDIVTEGINNVLYREALGQAADEVEKGVALSTALERFELFPPILYQMIRVGEETGKLDEILTKVSEYFESESEQAVRNMTAAIEPMIMIVLGIGVGLMVIAVIMPIYSLTSQF